MPDMPKIRKAGTKPWYSIRAAAGTDTVEVLIYGDIGESWFGESVTAKKFVEDLQELSDKNLIIRINSYGGSVHDGLAIYNAIERHPKHVEAVVDGVAVSIASFIPMAADEITIAENGIMMVHAPWGGVVGNAIEVRAYADVLDKFADAMRAGYARQTEHPDDVDEWLTDGEDHWFTATEAAEAGLVDEISSPVEEDEAARFQTAAFARFKVPAAVAAAFRKTPSPSEVSAMPPNDTPKPGTAAPDTAAQGAPPETQTNVVKIEQAAEARLRDSLRTRNAAIDAAFAKFMHIDGVAAIHRACIADPEISLQAATSKLIDKLGDGTAPVAPAVSGRVQPGADERDKFRSAAADALLVRAGIHRLKGNGVSPLTIDMNGNPYRGNTLLDLAKAALRRAGKNPDGMDKREIVAQAFQTTSDFPVLLENVMHKTLLQSYAITLDTWSRFCARGQVSDFRAHNRYRVGSFGNLDSLSEHGEFKTKTMPDGEKASITAKTKGNLIAITRDVIINDDLGALTNIGQAAGRAARRSIEADVYALLALNGGLGPLLSDNKTLFHADHGNIGSGAALSVDAIDADRVLMASQMDVGGNDFLDLRPSILLVPVGIGGKAREINAQEYNDESNKNQRRPNSVRGLFSDVVDTPRMTGTRRYLFADPADAPVIEVAFLDGNDAPFFETKDGWTVDGAELKVRLDYATAGIDYRGAVTNAGA